MTWAHESDSPQTLRRKFAALEQLERELGLPALWQHARVNPNEKDDRFDGRVESSSEDEVYFQAPKKRNSAERVQDEPVQDEEFSDFEIEQESSVVFNEDDDDDEDEEFFESPIKKSKRKSASTSTVTSQPPRAPSKPVK